MSRAQFPILFAYRDILAGNNYVAGVQARGRCLMVEEDEGFWVYGVNPGGLSAGGKTEREATSAFRDMYRMALFDLVIEAPTVNELRKELEALVNESNPYYESAWWEAVQQVRRENLTLDWLKTKQGADDAESQPGVVVCELTLLGSEQPGAGDCSQHPAPSQNDLDHLIQAA